MISSILAWFTDPATGRARTASPTARSSTSSTPPMAVLLAAAIAIPLGLWVGHTGRLRWLVSVANSVRAVPTLGLLLAASLWLGPMIQSDLAFTIPSILVLALLAIPPLLAGTYAGIEAGPPRGS